MRDDSLVRIDDVEVFSDRLKPGYTNLGGWTATGGADQSDDSVLGLTLGEGIEKFTVGGAGWGDVAGEGLTNGLVAGDGAGAEGGAGEGAIRAEGAVTVVVTVDGESVLYDVGTADANGLEAAVVVGDGWLHWMRGWVSEVSLVPLGVSADLGTVRSRYTTSLICGSDPVSSATAWSCRASDRSTPFI